MFFSLTLSKATSSIVHERSLIQKAKFPHESIVLSIVLSNIFHLLFSLGLLLLLILLNDLITKGTFQILTIIRWTLLVPLIIWLSLLTSGIALGSAALNVKYRDTNFIIQALLSLWFYATPIVYTLNLVPSNLHILFFLNPMSSLIECFRFTLLGMPITSWNSVAFNLLMTGGIFIHGWQTFKRESPFFADRL